MIVYDHDPDIVRWGLHQLIDVCTPSNTGSCSSVTHYETDTDQVAYVREFYDNSVYMNNVENDAAIARALQDELSRIASAEAFGSNNPEQKSVLVQDWLVPDRRQHNSACAEHVNYQKVDGGEQLIDVDISIIEENGSSKNEMEERDGIVCSVSVTSVEESHNMEELSHSFDIADESTLDGEVGKRIHQMVPIPHVPKINGEIPTEDEEISDHQRLLDRLKVYDLVENKVQGDGNCQFRSLSDQLYRTSDYHKTVRDRIVNQLKCYPEMYEGYVPMAYGDYLKRMSKSGEWGDHVTLQAAADVYGVKIFMITSFKDTCYIEILPKAQMSTRVIFLSFWAEVHYNSIYPEGEVPPPENKKMKNGGHFEAAKNIQQQLLYFTQSAVQVLLKDLLAVGLYLNMNGSRLQADAHYCYYSAFTYR